MDPRKLLSSARTWISLALLLIAAWVIVMLVQSSTYIHGLTHPACPAGSDQAGFQSVSIPVAGTPGLRAWWRAPQNGVVVLYLGGLGANRDALIPEARALAKHGYGALSADPLNCLTGQSTIGYKEAAGVRAMAKYALAQPGVQHVVAMGFSAGSVAVLHAAADLPQIEAVIAEGNFANLYDEMTSDPADLFSTEWQAQRASALAYAVQTGIWPGQVSPLDDLKALCPRPVFLVQGEKEAAHTRAAAQLAAATACGSAAHTHLWVVPGADHGTYLQVRPEEYLGRLEQFLQEDIGN
jgi:pimeloyl-ACP methyl ester carboxylesterase